MLLRIAIVLSTALAAGCSYRVAKGQYEQGFSAIAREDSSYVVRYNGESMEPEWALERLLRKGVADVCADDNFQLAEIKYETMEVMERWKSPYRTITAIASCGRQP